MGELLHGKGGTKFYNPPKAVPILGMASDGHQIFLTGGGGGSTASKEVPNQVQVHRLDEATGKVTTTTTLNTEKSVVIHLSYVLASGLWLACTQARCMVLELADDGALLKQVCEWNCEESGKMPEVNVARADPSGELVATGGTDGRVRIWRFAQARGAPNLQRACTEKQEVLDLDFSPDGKCLASCHRSGPCHLWEASTGEESFSLKYEKSGKMLTTKAVRFTTHAERAVPMLVIAANSGPRDPSYIGLFGTDGSKFGEVKADKLPVTAMALDVRGQWVAVTLVSGAKKVYSLPDLRLLKGIDGVHDLPAPCVAFVSENAVSAGGDRTINILHFSRYDGAGKGMMLLYMFIVLAMLFYFIYLTLRIGVKGAALQQGSQGEL
mmetsp:Transcript_72595/g.200265  ORF Transcript_72595/g.200265 Transcript_72595/m.200265 type:complete len:381 (-) Transcript_72595:143-1285(-)|eukprot:CAMPEP_0179112510 /NCGR_PEP_ID=MMETSP0796-20121207/52596_1 /TAXON_ID=73915 /ORGANISM="Pyrodinium bahamense, Strain pbaha01" /LENGTH=380 /DNA_ID=CAMNT_0020810681 /DNA_START=52 /DNA_END=1194 /DNA_ORIENTATION=-